LKSFIEIPRTSEVYTADSCIKKQTDEFYNNEIFKEEESRFGCRICNKMFRGSLFVQKHIQNKHENALDKVREQGIFAQYQKKL